MNIKAIITTISTDITFATLNNITLSSVCSIFYPHLFLKSPQTTLSLLNSIDLNQENEVHFSGYFIDYRPKFANKSEIL
jgi:hypothetical protein